MARGKIRKLTTEQLQEILAILKDRFVNYMNRHPDLDWDSIQIRLETDTEKLWSLNEMEVTGGEPDVIGYDTQTDEYLFCDCSAESPKGRRSICYDRDGQESRREHQPENNAVDMAAEMGIELLSEEQYRTLQELEDFDTKTSSWIKTPTEIRKIGGALFADFRYGRVFVYHNSAPSYYGSRGFRGMLRV